jgi:hypothetical protein
MKYRLLSQKELEILEEDLKHFLIVNGVHGDEWAEMNEKSPEKALNLVELFSDTVLQKVYENLKFIEHRSSASCMVFYLKKDEIELVSINAKEAEIDLSTPEGVHNALANEPSKLSVFRSNKSYSKERELEVHEMLEQGCVNSSEAFWIQLQKIF